MSKNLAPQKVFMEKISQNLEIIIKVNNIGYKRSRFLYYLHACKKTKDTQKEAKMQVVSPKGSVQKFAKIKGFSIIWEITAFEILVILPNLVQKIGIYRIILFAFTTKSL